MSTIVPLGARFGRYEVHSQLGAGGMGEVYLAQDVLLKRPVALKLLSLIQNKDRLRRFEQEARATSALNHPNILTIYEIGQENALHYIAAEFIDGDTLRRHMAHQRLRLIEVLDIAIQVATALTEAHAAGVIHRDIKPENIMIRRDHIVKVLDFGLAKLTESMHRHFASPEASTIPDIHTDPGTMVGTVIYMSPEQLRAQKVDGRTDIWSLGVVLYEMLAGRTPFESETKSDAIVSILEKEPPALTARTSELPTELQRIVTKALRKNKDERYQTAKDMLLDLRSLRQELDLQTKLKQSPYSGAHLLAASERLTVEAAKSPPDTDEVKRARATLSIEQIVSEIKQHKTGALIFLLLLLLVAVPLIALWRTGLLSGRKATEAQQLTFKSLLSTDNAGQVAISPDGKYVAYVIESTGQQSLWIKQLAASADIRVVAPGAEKFAGLTFSRDSSYVYFLRKEGDDKTLYQVAVLGGAPRKLIAGVETPVTFSPDGGRMAFVRRKGDATALTISNADGTGERELAVRPRPNIFTLSGTPPIGPAWSPDGKVIACPTLNLAESTMGVVAANVVDGSVKEINNRPWFRIKQLAWLPDSDGLIMNALDHLTSVPQLWSLSYPAGEARKVTNDPNAYEGLSMTADAYVLVTVRSQQLSTLWLAPAGDEGGQAAQIPTSHSKGAYGISWTTANKIVYASNEGGHFNIWSMDADGSNPRQLTFGDHLDIQPVVSRDGRRIVFVSYRMGTAHLWRMDADGSNPIQLTNGLYENMPTLSPDGKWVVYHGLAEGKDWIWKVSIEGGQPVRLADKEAIQPAVSPDGKLIAYFTRDGGSANSPWKMAIMPFDGGQPAKEFNIPPTVDTLWYSIRWTPDGRALTYVADTDGVSNVWSQQVEGVGEPIRLTDFKESRIFSFDWSPDGSRLACVRGITNKEIVLIYGFR
jgi:eukaryotic-like serine/threonine-protein kinase